MIQDTPWKVNKEILNVAKTVFNDDSRNRGGLITSKLMDLPNKPASIKNKNKTEEELRAFSKWKSEATIVYTQNQKLRSKRLAEANTIYIANKKSYSILEVARMFKSKIKFLPKRLGERYASALINKNLSNKMYKYFGKINLKDYINNFILK